jgi:shikimate 5-dehydrogenase
VNALAALALTLRNEYLSVPMTTKSKVAVVTGAGSGIGRAAALALIADGYQVALAGRRQEPLRATAESSADPSRALVVPTDVRNPPEVKSLFARARDAFGRVDVLFNNAGVGSPPAAFEDLTIEEGGENKPRFHPSERPIKPPPRTSSPSGRPQSARIHGE